MNVQKINEMSQSAAKPLSLVRYEEGSETSRKAYTVSTVEVGNSLNRDEDIVRSLWRHKAELKARFTSNDSKQTTKDGFMVLRPERIALIKTVASY